MRSSAHRVGYACLLCCVATSCGHDDAATATSGAGGAASSTGTGSTGSPTASSTSSGAGGEAASGGSGGGASGLYAPDDGPTHETGTLVEVCSEQEILAAIADASPGDVVTVCPGTFRFNQLISLKSDGESNARIFLRAEQPGTATFELSHIENFKISGSHWIIENLTFRGVCTDGSGCEHAFHFVGDADDVIVRNNEVVDFASHVKLNGEVVGSGPAKAFPDRAWFIGNTWRNTKFVPNDAPHNILNLDGGVGHVIRGNTFADFATPSTLPKSASAIYPKASARELLIEQNLIVCEIVRTDGETARGIQLGDGAPPSICDGDLDQDGNGDCVENGQSQLALVRNNILIGCNNGGSSAGIFVGSDRGSRIVHNTVVGSTPRASAFHVGHPSHDTFYRFNVLELGFDTNFAERLPTEADNVSLDATSVGALFVDAKSGDFTLLDEGAVLDAFAPDPEVGHDFCGYPRTGNADIGAIEYSTSYGGTACATLVRQMYDAITD
jgi:hypothetical protein